MAPKTTTTKSESTSGASLVSPLSKACNHSHYTGNSYAENAIGLHQAWHSGYYEGSTARGW